MSEQKENGKQDKDVGKKSNLLVVGNSWDQFGGTFLGDSNRWRYDLLGDIDAALAKMSNGGYDALLVEKSFFNSYLERGEFFRSQSLLMDIPIGFVLVDKDQKILWFNKQFQNWCVTEATIGTKFYIPLGRPPMRGPDFCPFWTIRTTNKPSMTRLYQQEYSRYLRMDATPLYNEAGEIVNFLVELRDDTEVQIKEVKLERLRDACKELADLTTKDISMLTPEQRIDILRAKIAKYAKEILNFDTIEIRILSQKEPELLEPLLALGMAETAKQRVLYARQEGNGITGWVAFHGKPYRMDDPTEDHFYIEGVPGARSSITAPLLYHGTVIGTFNVESQRRNAFDENDMRLLEMYADGVASAIHTLDLLSYEQKDTAYRSIETVYRDALSPLNAILLECARLRKAEFNNRELVTAVCHVQEEARKIHAAFKDFIVDIAPDLPQEKSTTDCRNYPMLRNKRVLMIDSDPSSSSELSTMLFYYGCIVETATNGENALKMLESAHYDAYFCNVKLEDMSAFLLFKQARCILCHRKNPGMDVSDCVSPFEETPCESDKRPFVPFIYMKSYGYDGDHVTTKAKEAGVIGLVYKPFIRTQILDTLKRVILKAEAES